MSTSTFDSAYEAHYRLIDVQEVDLYRWTVWCNGEGCRWRRTEYSQEQARDVALTHCRKVHTQ